MNIRILLDRLSSNLAILSNKLVIDNSNNDFSLNIQLETTFFKILNVVYGYNLENANLLKANSPGVDGIDEDNKLLVQVTSTFSNQKIEHTIDQVLKEGLHKKYDKLLIVFLKNNKRPLSASFLKKIKTKIKGKLEIDFNDFIIDSNDIFKRLSGEQDFQKIESCVNILNGVLDLVPAQKLAGYQLVSLSFDDEEVENVYKLVHQLLFLRVNVYIKSKKLYDRFLKSKQGLIDYLIFVSPQTDLGHINHTITILSNNYIKNNLSEEKQSEKNCCLLNSALINNNRFQVLCFDNYIDNKSISNELFRSYISVQKETLSFKVKEILNKLFSQPFSVRYNIDEIKEELKNSYSGFFTVNNITDHDDYNLFHFKMEEHDDMVMNYIILKKDYRLTRATTNFNKKYKKTYSKNLIILVPKDHNHKTRRRILNVKSSFKTTAKVHYIDEHLFDRKFKNIEQARLLEIEDREFVNPVIICSKEEEKINDVIHWIVNEPDSPIAIIKAAGGIGKTTLCEKIHDNLIKDYNRYIVIFIDANKYIEEFGKNNFKDDAKYDLYTIFNACHEH